jgi:peptidoglycan/LPS O-acetylase OafA/YrhL
MQGSQKQVHIPELDGLRGAAIFLVLVYHYVSQQGAAPAGSLTAYVQRTVSMWATGVDLFFVLSGFLIGSILMEQRESPSFFRTFYIRRFFRIIPLYYLWTSLYIVLVIGAGPFLRAHAHSGMTPQLGWPVYIHYLFLQNFALFSLAGLAGAWFGPTWSLAIEEQFYLLAPVVVRLASPQRLSTALISTIAAIPVLRILMLWAGHPSAAAISVTMLCRADALATGILAALLWRRTEFRVWAARHARLLYALLLFCMAGFAALWKWSPETQTRAMESVGFTVTALTYAMLLLLALARPSGPIAILARMRSLRALGRISYCVYIIHVAVNVICHAVLLRDTPRVSTPKGLAVTILAALLTCTLAGVSWFLLENPLLRRGHKYKYEKPARAAAGSYIPLPPLYPGEQPAWPLAGQVSPEPPLQDSPGA